MTHLVDLLLTVPPLVAYVLIAALVFAEAAVFVGRFTAFLRAVRPAMAGLNGMPYRRFLLFNATGGLVWGVGVVLAGFFAGHSYVRVEKALGRGGAVLLALVVVAGLLVWHRHRLARAQARALVPPPGP